MVAYFDNTTELVSDKPLLDLDLVSFGPGLVESKFCWVKVLLGPASVESDESGGEFQIALECIQVLFESFK